MTLVTPLPYVAQSGIAIPGLITDIAAFNALLGQFDTLPLGERYQALDDAAATLRSSGNLDMAVRIEEQVFQWHIGNADYQDESLIGDLQGAFRALVEEGNAKEESEADADHNRAVQMVLQRFRLLTRPVSGHSGQRVLIRAPAFLLERLDPTPSLVREFGKVVPQLWALDREAARELFDQWTGQTSSARARELHCFTRSEEKARLFAQRFAHQGFEVRYAAIPGDLRTMRSYPSLKEVESSSPLYWVVGLASTEPLSLWLDRFMGSREGLAVEHLDLAGRHDIPVDDPELDQRLQFLFGRPISFGEVLRGFAIDVPGYVAHRVRLERRGESGVSILSEIATRDGEMAARLTGWIPSIPKPGEPWIAWGDDLNEGLQREVPAHKIAQHMRRGIGRRVMQKVLYLLYHIGADALAMEARLQGLAFMPYIGFDFAKDKIRDQVVADLLAYIDEMGITLSPQKEEEIRRIRRAWEVVDFELEDGSLLGREFLDYYSREEKSLPLIFWLRPEYPGWSRLFSKQLAAIADETSSIERVRERRHTIAQRLSLQRRLHELVRSPHRYDSQVPVEVRRTLAQLSDMILLLEDDVRQERRQANRDSLTGLINRRELMRHNRELEKSLAGQRGDDPQNRHWVLMLDIDHFKQVNDKQGHLIGDLVIQRVARILEDVAREYDLVSRYGGEEFCLVLRHAGLEGSRRVAETIRQTVEQEEFPTQGSSTFRVTISIGAAPFRLVAPPGSPNGSTEPNPFEEVSDENTSLYASIGDADRLLYRAKQGGRNRIIYFR